MELLLQLQSVCCSYTCVMFRRCHINHKLQKLTVSESENLVIIQNKTCCMMDGSNMMEHQGSAFFPELFCRQVIKSRYRKWNMLMILKGKTQQKPPPAAWWEQLVVFSRGRVEAETLELWYRGGNNKINANHWRVLKVLLSQVLTIQSHSDKSWGAAAELFSFFLFNFYFLIYFDFVKNARKSVFSPLFIAFFQKEGTEARRTQGGGSEARPQGVASAELQLQQLQQLHVFGSRIFNKVMQERGVKVELSSG